MAFIGTPLDTRNTFQSLVGKRFNGDGSETAFTLDVAPSSVLDIEVFVGNVRQDPNSAYTLSGTTLTFTGAPPSGTNNIYVVHQAKSVGTINAPDNSVDSAQLNTALLTGATDIGAAIADADLFLVDDGAGGTLRKTAASRIKTYIGTSPVTALNNATANELVTVGSTTTELDAEANLTFDGDTLTANKVILTNSSGLTGGASSDGFITNADDTDTGIVFPDSDRIQFWTGDSEKMRIESSGSVEIKIDGSGFKNFIKFENAAGDTTYGVVGAEGANSAIIGSGDTALKVDAANDIFRPYTISGTGGRDDAIDLGSGSHRFDDVFATNGSIQTSDKNQKNTITATDLGLAFVDKLTPVSYKFNNKTRTHYGLIAQDVETVLGDISKSTADFAGFIKTDI